MKVAGDQSNTTTHTTSEVESDFGNAFDEASETGAKTEPKTEDLPTDDTGAPPTDDTGNEPPQGKDKGDQPQANDLPASDEHGAKVENTQPNGDTEANEPWEHKYRSLNGKFVKEAQRRQTLEQENEELRRKIAAKSASKDTDAPATGEAADPNDEDAQVLRELEEEMPTMAKAIKRLLAKQRREIEESLQPMVASVHEDAKAKHFSTIKSEHKDFDALIGDVAEWVDSQPDYIKNGMQSVLNQGDAQEVIDLVSRFKKDTGISSTKEPEPQDDSAARRRARQLEDAEAVRTKGAPQIPKGEADKDDFNGAFEEASQHIQ